VSDRTWRVDPGARLISDVAARLCATATATQYHRTDAGSPSAANWSGPWHTYGVFSPMSVVVQLWTRKTYVSPSCHQPACKSSNPCSTPVEIGRPPLAGTRRVSLDRRSRLHAILRITDNKDTVLWRPWARVQCPREASYMFRVSRGPPTQERAQQHYYYIANGAGACCAAPRSSTTCRGAMPVSGPVWTVMNR